VTEPDELEIESKGAAPGTFDAITAKAAPAIRAIEKSGIICYMPASMKRASLPSAIRQPITAWLLSDDE
jgi:hypothetical protein